MERASLPKIELPQLMGYEWPCTQSYLLGRFVCRQELHVFFFHRPAQSPANIASLLPGDLSHPLWWDGAVAAFLQQAAASAFVTTVAADVATQRRLSSVRPRAGFVVHHHGWPAADQQTRDSAIQRNLSLLAGTPSVSGSVYPTPSPQTDEYPVRPSACQLARSIARSTLSSARTANHSHPRSRFC